MTPQQTGRPYVLLYYGTGPDRYADTWPGYTGEALHTARHAQHPRWTRAPRRAVSTAEANRASYSRCYCLPAEGELP